MLLDPVEDRPALSHGSCALKIDGPVVHQILLLGIETCAHRRGACDAECRGVVPSSMKSAS